MGRVRSILVTMVILGTLAGVAGYGTFSAFSSTTSNSANSFSSGTVVLADNDAGGAMWSVTNARPADQVQACIKVTYTGSLPATVKLYVSSSTGTLGTYLDLTIEKVTFSVAPAFPSCAGALSPTTLSSGGTLAAFAAGATSYANGLAAYPGAQTQWNQNDAVFYRFTLTLQNSNAAQGLSATTAFTWEAQNQ